jgi:hypothetical protein
MRILRQSEGVFTAAYTRAWPPPQKPFLTVIVTCEEPLRRAAAELHGRRAEPRDGAGFHRGGLGAPISLPPWSRTL